MLNLIYVSGGNYIYYFNFYQTDKSIRKGVRFMLGRYAGLMNPGWRLVLPIIQSYKS